MNFFSGYDGRTVEVLDQHQLDQAMRDIEEVWRTFFDIVYRLSHDHASDSFDRKHPMSMKILNFSPEHPVSQAILYIFAMDTFIPGALQRANRTQNTALMKSLGALAVFLAEIVYISQKSRTTSNFGSIQSLQPTYEAYLGTSVPASMVSEHGAFRERNYLQNRNFLSVSLSKEFALKQALRLTELRNGANGGNDAANAGRHVPVLMELYFDQKFFLNSFELNSLQYSPYADTEQEVVLKNSLMFEVTQHSVENVTRAYGQVADNVTVVRLANMEDPRLYATSKVAPVIKFYQKYKWIAKFF